MKIKTNEPIGPALDWLVAKCVGDFSLYHDIEQGQRFLNLWVDSAFLKYSSLWSCGGPIIERECIATYASGACSVPPKNPDYWVAEILATDEMFTQFGPTPLIAAMRCYVALKLGDVVEVPEELVQ